MRIRRIPRRLIQMLNDKKTKIRYVVRALNAGPIDSEDLDKIHERAKVLTGLSLSMIAVLASMYGPEVIQSSQSVVASLGLALFLALLTFFLTERGEKAYYEILAKFLYLTTGILFIWASYIFVARFLVGVPLLIVQVLAIGFIGWGIINTGLSARNTFVHIRQSVPHERRDR